MRYSEFGRLALQSYLNILAINTHWICLYRPDGGRIDGLSRRHVKLSAVARALDEAALKITQSKDPTIVGTGVPDSVIRPSHVTQHDVFTPFRDYSFGLPRTNLSDGGHSNKLEFLHPNPGGGALD